MDLLFKCGFVGFSIHYGNTKSKSPKNNHTASELCSHVPRKTTRSHQEDHEMSPGRRQHLPSKNQAERKHTANREQPNKNRWLQAVRVFSTSRPFHHHISLLWVWMTPLQKTIMLRSVMRRNDTLTNQKQKQQASLSMQLLCYFNLIACCGP